MSAGDGYRYLLNTVVVGDGERDFTEPLTRYYLEVGTPPGFWMGSGIVGFGTGALQAGGEVAETQLQLLLGHSCDPVSGEPLGRRHTVFAPVEKRIAHRIRRLPLSISLDERAEQVSSAP